MQLLGRHPGEYEMTKEVIEVHFDGVAARKLRDLFERGYTVCGVAIQRIHQSGNFDRGAITTGGMVMWWQKLFSGDEFEASNVQQPSNALQLAEALHEMANTYLPTGGDFVPGPRSKADELIDEAASELRRQHARIADLEAENSGLRILASGGIVLFERYSTFKAKCEELEAMLDAVGAGGVGQSIKPQIQADTAPAAWAIYSDDGTAIRLWSKDKATAQEAADKFGRPLVPLYTAPQPARQPLTDEQIKSAVRHLYASNAVAAMASSGDIDTARAIEAAHGITGGQP